MAGQENSGFDFAVPGQDEEPKQEAISRPVPEKNAVKESGISLFWLLQHYSRENASVYKAQQEEKKLAKAAKKLEKKQKRAPKQASSVSDDRDLQEGSDQGSGRLDRSINKDLQQDHPKGFRKRGNYQGSVLNDNFGETVMVERNRRPGLAAGQMPPEAALECMGFGQTVPLHKIPFVIGRSPDDVDLCIADNRRVGRIHASISYHNGVYYIKDLKSLNHVYLDGRQILPETETQLGDRMKITLGNEEFIFHIGNG